MNALSPAKVQHVSILGDERDRIMEVVVEDQQLSLAIGKKGQNVRLAAKLTGWRIDIKSEEEKRREVEAQFGALELGGDQAMADGEATDEMPAEAQEEMSGEAQDALPDVGDAPTAEAQDERSDGPQGEASEGAVEFQGTPSNEEPEPGASDDAAPAADASAPERDNT
jgi:N utilization substance protein A